jgi:predicted permease
MLMHRRQFDADLEEEMRLHLELLQQEKLQSGMTADDARAAARRRFGNPTALREKIFLVCGWEWLEHFAQDVRYGFRMLRKSPGLTAVAVLTLALGIGANTAIFSLIDAILLRTLPAESPHELVLFSDSPEGGANSGTQTGQWKHFSTENYTYFHDNSESFKDLCAFQSSWNHLKIRVAGASERPDLAYGRLVSGNFFSFLGLSAAAGRLFLPDDDRPGASPVVVLNYTYWTRKFHNDLSIIGKTVEANGTSFTIIGVAPRAFSDVKYDPPDLWLPLVSQPKVMSTNSYAQDPEMYWLNIMARLKPGVTLRQARTVVNGQLKQILATPAHRETDQQIARSYIELAPGGGGISYLRTTYSGALQVLAGIVGIILLIACANVANLLLSRSSAREKEISIRLAIGASRSRLIRQLLTESMLLSALGGLLGILTASWGAELLTSLVTGSDSIVQASIDARLLLFTAGVSILSGILFGLVPALRSSRIDLATQVKGSPRPRLGFAFANGLVVFQIAASVVLLVGAGLLLRTLQKLTEQELGFDEDHIFAARINPEAAGYNPAQTPALYQALIDHIETIPGVLSATIDYSEPFSGSTWTSNFSIEGLPSRPEMLVHKELVGPRYFETEGTPILLGRDIGPQDRPGIPLVTVINQTMARKFFPGVNPIGKRFSLGSPFNDKEAMTIVGVAADARYYSLRDTVPAMEFCAAFQIPDQASHTSAYAGDVEVRVSGNPIAIPSEIRAALAQVSNSLPVTRVTLLKEEVNDSVRLNRSTAELSSAFGVLALFLSCIGVYGTMACRVSHRTHEIGIRLALGAQRANVLWLIAKECLILVVVGLVIGVPIALTSTSIIASQLFGVRATDPLTFAAAAILPVLVALAACYVPAQRAVRVDPMVALKYE